MIDELEPHELIAEIRVMIERLDDLRLHEISSPIERVELYAAVEVLPRELAVLVAGMRQDAIVAMADLDVPKGVMLDLAHGGAVRKSRNVARYSWRGWELCDAIAEDRIEIGTGEIVRAVDVDTLRAVLPACASERLTSSKWNASALPADLVERYREGEAVYEDTIEIIPKMARDA
jgi:hypothetical protein